jgi:hypothetical protein
VFLIKTFFRLGLDLNDRSCMTRSVISWCMIQEQFAPKFGIRFGTKFGINFGANLRLVAVH